MSYPTPEYLLGPQPEDVGVVANRVVIRSKLDEETIRREYNDVRILTHDQTTRRWCNIMGEYFQPAFDWAVNQITELSNVGFDLTHSEGRANSRAVTSNMMINLNDIFNAEYQGPELARFYQKKAAKGVVYLANKSVQRNSINTIIDRSVTSPVEEHEFPNERTPFPDEPPRDPSPEGMTSQAEPWTLLLLSARTGNVVTRLYMQYVWQKEQPTVSDVDIRSLREECKSAMSHLDDWMRYIYVDYSAFNWPFYSDATLRTQFAEFAKDERTSSMYVYVEDRDPEAQGETLFPLWILHAGAIKDEPKQEGDGEQGNTGEHIVHDETCDRNIIFSLPSTSSYPTPIVNEPFPKFYAQQSLLALLKKDSGLSKPQDHSIKTILSNLEPTQSKVPDHNDRDTSRYGIPLQPSGDCGIPSKALREPMAMERKPGSRETKLTQRTEIEERNRIMRETFFALATPLNLILLGTLVLFIYFRLQPASTPTLPSGPAPIVFRTFTPRTLLPNNGTENQPVYLAVRGKVYDVTSGRNFYGPGGPYENFAGRDATRGLACQSFDEEMLTKNLDGPLDDCSDLTEEQLDNLKGWIERFDEKYLVVGKLIAFRKTDFH
ncbi:hypothetical protein LTR84_010400 [Exophiala bonariae]|uniref:Cytochrome b5 heme-binding domain-containing protein n=1 Tax=Exophiala bonariae TaxID=1690606 RepID=A0AAV9MTE1_9EURO|nr:hypothetical protein LTR84_010400 [Exophiala bonariae]